MKPWEQFTNQQQWKVYLQNLVRTNKKALYRSIILIADLQTPEEKVWGATIEKNNVGFGAVDAEMMTSLALRLKCGGELTERELAICRNKMPKYWRQLMIISKRRMKDERQARTKGEQAPDLEQGPGLGNHRDGGGLYPDSHPYCKGPDGPGEGSGGAQGIHSQPGETAG
jgi:hypothetical protein